MSTDCKFIVIVNNDDPDINITWTEKIKLPKLIYTGRLSTNLFNYIVDNYDNLPEYIINIQDREQRFYHQGSLVDFLNNPNLETKFNELNRGGYWNFGTQIFGEIKAHINNMKDSGWWSNCMQSYFGNIENHGDFILGKRSYWQFIISKEKILSYPVDFYKNIINWIETNTLEDSPPQYDPITNFKKLSANWQNKLSNYQTTKYVEYSLQLIFSNNLYIRLSNGKMCRAVYGAKNQFKDVTEVLISKFYNKDRKKFIFNKHIYWNDCFGDVYPNVPKILKIQLDDDHIEITEDFTISL